MTSTMGRFQVIHPTTQALATHLAKRENKFLRHERASNKRSAGGSYLRAMCGAGYNYPSTTMFADARDVYKPMTCRACALAIEARLPDTSTPNQSNH